MSKILTLILLIAGLFVGVYLVGRQTGLFSRAELSAAPQDIKISNISDNSFTVSWMSAKAVNGFVSFGTTEGLGETAADDRDSSGPKPRLTHHVTLKNLNPQTDYFYKINTGTIAKQATAPTTKDTPPLADPVFGKVTNVDKTPVSGAIIYSTVGGSTLLSSYTRDEGNFLITLNNARTKDLKSYAVISDSDQISLEVKSQQGSLQKQIPALSRKTAIQLILQQTQPVKKSWPADFNNDGMINVVDYAFYIREQLSK